MIRRPFVAFSAAIFASTADFTGFSGVILLMRRFHSAFGLMNLASAGDSLPMLQVLGAQTTTPSSGGGDTGRAGEPQPHDVPGRASYRAMRTPGHRVRP